MICGRIALFSKFKPGYWKNLLIFAIYCINLVNFFWTFRNGTVPGDYLAYWSVGKIAREGGYPKLYDLLILKDSQTKELQLHGYIDKTETILLPVAYFPVFILPFHLLSYFPLIMSFWLWTILNLVGLIIYLIFFTRWITLLNGTTVSTSKLIILMLLSSSILFNFQNGQINVFLLVCMGEFIRNAVMKKPFLSGLWLGGLLLKPVLLILIIPIFFLKHNWKAMMGFMVSANVILVTSLILSKMAGIKALVYLWTKYSVGFTATAPENMVNWRMVGLHFNNFFNTAFGSVITISGIIVTLLAVIFLVKQNTPYGTSPWVMIMLGVFSATLSITLHSHYHMAMVLIPLLIYAHLYRMLPEKILFAWVIVTPTALVGIQIIDLIIFLIAKADFARYQAMVIGLIGLILNLLVLFSTLRYAIGIDLKGHNSPDESTLTHY